MRNYFSTRMPASGFTQASENSGQRKMTGKEDKFILTTDSSFHPPRRSKPEATKNQSKTKDQTP